MNNLDHNDMQDSHDVNNAHDAVQVLKHAFDIPTQQVADSVQPFQLVGSSVQPVQPVADSVQPVQPFGQDRAINIVLASGENLKVNIYK